MNFCVHICPFRVPNTAPICKPTLFAATIIIFDSKRLNESYANANANSYKFSMKICPYNKSCIFILTSAYKNISLNTV